MQLTRVIFTDHRHTNLAESIGINKELFLDYGKGYWAEGTFEDYLAERENSGKGPEQDGGESAHGTGTGSGT